MSHSAEGLEFKFRGPGGESDGTFGAPIVLPAQSCSFPVSIVLPPES